MDLQDFNVDTLYFEQSQDGDIERLLAQAASRYGTPGAESSLLQAYQLAPNNLSVLVGLYRYYFYQHRYEDALFIAQQLLTTVAPRIEFPDSWRNLRKSHLAHGVMISIGFVRFYLLALKASGYIQLRLGEFQEGADMLRKVIEMDAANRLGAKQLLDLLDRNSADIIAFPLKASKEA